MSRKLGVVILLREYLESRILYKTKVNRGLAAEWFEVFDSWFDRFDGKTRDDVSALVQDSRRRREQFTHKQSHPRSRAILSAQRIGCLRLRFRSCDSLSSR